MGEPAWTEYELLELLSKERKDSEDGSITVIWIAGRYARDGVMAWRLPVCVVS